VPSLFESADAVHSIRGPGIAPRASESHPRVLQERFARLDGVPDANIDFSNSSMSGVFHGSTPLANVPSREATSGYHRHSVAFRHASTPSRKQSRTSVGEREFASAPRRCDRTSLHKIALFGLRRQPVARTARVCTLMMIMGSSSMMPKPIASPFRRDAKARARRQPPAWPRTPRRCRTDRGNFVFGLERSHASGLNFSIHANVRGPA